MTRNLVLIGKSRTYPKGKYEDDIDVIYAHENGLDELEMAEDNGQMEYFVLILLKTDKKEHPNLELVNKDWEDISGGSLFDIEFITENRKQITKSFRYMLDEWLNETIRFKLPVVGYSIESKNEKKEAKKLLLNSAIKRAWQFWK